MDTIRENAARVRERVAAALERCGRPSGDVTVVAVTKTFGADVVNAVLDAGIEDIGENRVQEFLAKRDGVDRPCRWHLVGHLQRNKATKVVGAFHMVQSIDSVRIAQTLDRLGGERGVETRGLLEVNTSGESAKYGVVPDQALECASRIATLDNVRLEGLMTVGPVSMDRADTRRCFSELRALRDRIRSETGLELPHLSMGMTGDFEIAIEEGATIVRLGRILTGERS